MQTVKKAEALTNPHHILVIDDDFDICSQIQDMLENRDENYIIEVAANLGQAEEIAARFQPDIILFDANNHTEQQLTNLPHFAAYNPDIEYIFLTSQTHAEKLRKQLPTLVADFHYKPVDNVKLLKSIELLISRQELKREKEATQHKYDILFNNNDNLIFSLSEDGVIQDVNNTATKFANMDKSKLIGQPLWSSAWASDSPEFGSYLQEIFQSPKMQVIEFEMSLNDAICAKRLFQFTLKHVQQGTTNDAGYLLEGHDITEQRLAEQKIRQLSYIDHLTGLCNHAWFFQTVTRALTNAERHNRCCAILSINIDNFSHFNERWGAHAGDNMLVEISRRLGSCIRHGDLASRRSGDSFTLFLDEISDEEDAGLVAYRVNKTIAYHSPLDQQHPPITASIGISIFPHDGKDARSLITKADQTLVETKKVDRGSFRFSYETE